MLVNTTGELFVNCLFFCIFFIYTVLGSGVYSKSIQKINIFSVFLLYGYATRYFKVIKSKLYRTFFFIIIRRLQPSSLTLHLHFLLILILNKSMKPA